MALSESSKTILAGTVKEWAKFAVERDRFTAIANDLALFTRKVIQECLAFVKAQNIDIECESPDAMKIMGVAVHIDPVVDATFPNVKGSVVLKCAGATRAIVVNANNTISAGGAIIQLEQLKKGIPDPFMANAADFVRDSFLYVARTGGKEE